MGERVAIRCASLHLKLHGSSSSNSSSILDCCSPVLVCFDKSNAHTFRPSSSSSSNVGVGGILKNCTIASKKRSGGLFTGSPFGRSLKIKNALTASIRVVLRFREQ